MTIQLELKRENRWLDLGFDGVKVEVRPMTTLIYEAARNRAGRLLQEIAENVESVAAIGGTVEGLPDLDDPDGRAGLFQLIRGQSLARAAIVNWVGVVGSETKDPLPVEGVWIDRLMLVAGVCEGFVEQYCYEFDLLDSEGKGSGISPNGTSAQVPDTAKAAGKKTRTAPKESAAQTGDTVATKKTRRKRTKAN